MRLLIALLALACWNTAQAQTPLTIGVQHEIPSQVLAEERRISVYLPRTYERQADAKYDVLYVLDGSSNLLHAAGSQYFLAGYRQMPELIIVGIHNTFRNRDLTPSVVAEVEGSGGAKTFRRFISDELIPFVEEQFRTTGRRYLSGHSYGGLFALDTLAEQPELFDAYFTFSPSLRWDNDIVLEKLKERFSDSPPNIYLYANIGAEGDRLERPIRVLEDMLSNLADDQLRWHVDWLPGENHSTTPVIGQFLAFRDFFGP